MLNSVRIIAEPILSKHSIFLYKCTNLQIALITCGRFRAERDVPGEPFECVFILRKWQNKKSGIMVKYFHYTPEIRQPCFRNQQCKQKGSPHGESWCSREYNQFPRILAEVYFHLPY